MFSCYQFWLARCMVVVAIHVYRTTILYCTILYIWGSKATPIFLAAHQSFFVFFGTLLFSSALATDTPNNLAMPHSTPIYWGRQATPNFLAAPQSTLVFFGTKAKPFLQSQFYSSHLFAPLLSSVRLKPHPFLKTSVSLPHPTPLIRLSSLNTR